MRVVVSGGGTGGHIYPALAIAESLRRRMPEIELLYIGGTSGMEAEIVPERGVPFQAVTARKLRAPLSLETFAVAASLTRGYCEARVALRGFCADVVAVTGGYVAAATALAASRLGIPVLVHEGNAVPGRTNRLLARIARRICVTFPETAACFPSERTVVTGLPLRHDIVAPPAVTPAIARSRFPGLDSDRFTLLVVGGSQGARALNRVTLRAAPALLQYGVQILHQTGARNLTEVTEAARAGGLMGQAGYAPVAYLDAMQMPFALRAADLLLCRGGVSTLAEGQRNALPMLVVPLPSAHADHQTANAKALAKSGAALLRPESALTPETLVQDVLALRRDVSARMELAKAARQLSYPDAADAVADEIFELARRRAPGR